MHISLLYELLHKFACTLMGHGRDGGADGWQVARHARDKQFGHTHTQRATTTTIANGARSPIAQCVRARWQTRVARVAVRLEKYRRRRNAAKNQSARWRRRRRRRTTPKKYICILNETRATNSDSSEIHPLIASIRQQTLSTFEMDAERSRKQKPPSPNVVRGKRKMCSKMPNTHTHVHGRR